jgi:GH24 family phage-related lysozyme (muramidase)
MPPNNQQQITQRGQGSPGQQSATFQPQERTVDTYAGAGQNDATLMGLVDGLKSFNPELQRYTQFQEQQAATSAFKAGTAQGQLADAGLVDAQTGGIKVPPPDDSYKVDPAFAQSFSAGYRNSVGVKIGSQVQNDITAAYAENKNKDGFDPEQFLHEQVAQHTAGLTDPAIIEQVSKNVAETSQAVRKDFAQVQFTRLKETANGNISAAMDSAMSPTASPADIYKSLITVAEPLRGQLGTMTRPEFWDAALDKVTNLSLKAGGRPELFDVFDQKDPNTGLTPLQMNPKLQSEVARMREHAVGEQNKRIEQGQQVDFFKTRQGDEDKAAQGIMPSMDDIAHRIAPLGMFKTGAEASSWYNHLQDVAGKAQEGVAAVTAINNGQGWGLSPDAYRKGMDAKLEGPVGVLMGAATGTTPGDLTKNPDVQMALQTVVQATARSGRSDIPNPKLKGLVDGTVNALPTKDGQPSSQFNTAAAMYGGLPDQLRSAYFDEKAQALFGAYKRQIDSGVDAATAYQNAYRSISPEAVKAAEQRMADPKWKEGVAKDIKGLTTGFANSIPLIGRAFGGTPQNTEATSGWAQVQLSDYYKRNPNATSDQAKAWIQDQYKSNYIYDATNHLDLQVPPGRASEQTAEAITAYTEKMQAKYGSDGIQVALSGYKDGTYQVALLRNGQFVGQAVPQVSFDQIIKDHSYTKAFSPEEQAGMAALTDKLNKGTATSQDLIDNSTVLAKAKSLNLINDTTLGKVKQVQSKAFDGALSNAFNFPADPKLGNGWFYNDKSDFAGLNGSRLTGQGSAMQVKQADQFLGSGNMTASVIAMGEGLVLKASQDPNPKAGLNIGYGYNLNANANNIGEDFRRAGIPSTSIEGIKSGKVQITPEQAARLLEVTAPRYEQRAKEAVEAAHPGLWTMVSPGQKAALADVAYQVGDVAQFKKAITALANKDLPGFQEALKVTYSDKNGNRQEDQRRNKLRNLAINGTSAWSQGLLEASRTAQ